MRRWIIIVGAVLFVLFVVGGVFVGWSLSRDAVSGPFARTAEPQLLWGGGEVQVNLALSSATLPSCPPASRSADIVLVIDQSKSMDGPPLQQAVNAADAFVQTVDLAVNRVAILFFSDEPNVVQSLSNDLPTLQRALLARSATGKTEIGKALREAQTLLFDTQGTLRSEANSVVILLSDGGASNKQQAQEVAQTLKREGVRLVTLALPGDDQDPLFMRALASRPSDAVDQPSLADLAAIYRSLAEEINEGVAFDVRVQERLNTDSFSVIEDSIDPTGGLDSASIEWEMGTLPEGESMFRYRLMTNAYGLRTISDTPGQASLKDCDGESPVWTLPEGPRVLIMPPLWLCLLCLPLLLLPLLFFGFFDWFRKKKPAPESAASTTSRRAKASSSTTSRRPGVSSDGDTTPPWLKSLLGRLPSKTGSVEKSTLQDTVLIGCGPAGREVLSQIAYVLRRRFGEKVPDNVRLLQIDVQLPEKAAPPAFPNEVGALIQQVLLQPDLEQIERNLQRSPEEWKHWKWYEASQEERASGRMALFYDLRNGSKNSGLWHALRRALIDLNAPRVRVIGTTFDDTSSGMLADLVRLTEVTTGLTFNVELWLAGPVEQTWSARLNNPRRRLRDDDQKGRSVATLRELKRLQRNAAVPFVYVPASNRQSELRGKAGGVVQTLFLFQPQHQAAAPEDDVFVCMADTLLALLHPDVNSALVDHLAANRPTAGKKINHDNFGMTSAVGCYAFRLPDQRLVNALTWRLVHDLLFDGTVGLIPRATCQADGSYTPIGDEERENKIKKREEQDAAEDFVNGFASSGQEIGSRAFLLRLRSEVDALINGGTEVDLIQRSNGLQRAHIWLKYVRRLVRQKGERSAANQIRALSEELEAWERWLTQEVYQVSHHYWQQTTTELDHLRKQPARKWVVDEELEWPLYQQKVRSKEDIENKELGELARAGARFGWQIEFEGGQWRLHLLVPPPDFVWSSSRVDSEPYIVKRTESPNELLHKLYNIAKSFTRLGNDSAQLLNAAKDQTQDQDAARQWLTLAERRLGYDDNDAARIMAQVAEKSLLVGPKTDQLQEIEKKLIDAQAGLDLSTVETADQSTIVLLRIHDWIPLSTTKEYDDERQSAHAPSAELHIWRAEQVATEIEKKGGPNLSPTFMNWLANDEEVVELFGRSYLYGVIKPDRRGEWRIPGLSAVSGNSAYEVLQKLMAQPPNILKHSRRRALATWKQAITEQKEQIKKNRNYLRDAKEKKIKPLLQSSDVTKRDLGRYLEYLMAKRD